MDFTNFYEKTGTDDYEKMYGKIVYVTIFPKKRNQYIYQERFWDTEHTEKIRSIRPFVSLLTGVTAIIS